VRAGEPNLPSLPDLGQDALTRIAVCVHAAKVEGRVYSRP
jgi:hypothetical protein